MPFHISFGEDDRRVIKPGKDFPIKLCEKPIAILTVSEKDPDELHVKAAHQGSLIIRSGFGFKNVVVNEAVVRQKDCIIHCQRTNIMIVVAFSAADATSTGDTDKEIIIKQ